MSAGLAKRGVLVRGLIWRSHADQIHLSKQENVAGCRRDGGGGTSATTGAQASPALVDPHVFAARIEAPGVVTINVHTPNEGRIAGTDLTIAFDQIAESSELPVDRGTPVAVYCRSGNMSADTVGDLEALGYTDIVELDGGFDGW